MKFWCYGTFDRFFGHIGNKRNFPCLDIKDEKRYFEFSLNRFHIYLRFFENRYRIMIRVYQYHPCLNWKLPKFVTFEISIVGLAYEPGWWCKVGSDSKFACFLTHKLHRRSLKKIWPSLVIFMMYTCNPLFCPIEEKMRISILAISEITRYLEKTVGRNSAVKSKPSDTKTFLHFSS